MKIDELLELKPLNTTDLPLLYDLYNCPEVYEQGILGYAFPLNDITLKSKLDSWLQSKDQRHYKICKGNNDIGIAQIYNISNVNKKCSIGILIKPNETEKGIGKKVFKVLLNICFQKLNIHKVELSIEDGNVRSIKLVESNNFALEGVLKESIYKNGEYKNVHLYGLIKNN